MRAFLLVLSLLLFTQGAYAQTTLPFGMEETPIGDGNIKKNWDAIRAASTEDTLSEEFLAFAKQFAGLQGRELVARVNQAVNLLPKTYLVTVRKEVQDPWFTPSQTLQEKTVYCIDKAVLKFAVLKRSLPAENLRVVIGQNPRTVAGGRFEEHAFTEVLIDGEWLVLDGTIVIGIVSDTQVNKFLWAFNPTYSLSEKGAFRLVRPYKQTQLP